MKNSVLLCILLFLTVHLIVSCEEHDTIATYKHDETFEGKINKGQILFQDKCAACHAISHLLIGPSLASYCDTTIAKLVHAYNTSSQSHTYTKVNTDELKYIEIYIVHNSKFCDP